MKKIVILLSLIAFISCDCDEECAEFDMNSDLSEWFLFRENRENYSFISESTGDVISFNNEEYDYTVSSYILEKDCKIFSFAYTEQCETFFKATFFSNDLNIEIENNISQFNHTNVGYDESFSLKIKRDNIRSNYYIEEGEENELTFTNSILINEIVYNDVISFNFDDDSGTVYISKGNGMIRLVLDDEVYDIE